MTHDVSHFDRSITRLLYLRALRVVHLAAALTIMALYVRLVNIIYLLLQIVQAHALRIPDTMKG